MTSINYSDRREVTDSLWRATQSMKQNEFNAYAEDLKKTLGEPKETDTEMISVEEYIRRFNPKTETRTTKSGTELVTVYFETGAKEYQKKLLHKNFVQVKKEA